MRGLIGFDGLLFSDDLSMKALPGTFAEKSQALFAAGVDIALHCNGDTAEAREVASVAPELAGEAARRVALARGLLRPPTAFDPEEAAAELDRRLAAIA